MSVLRDVAIGLDFVTLAYFVCLCLIYTTLAVIGWRAIESYVSRRPLRDYRRVATSPLSMPVTIVVPSYNEAGVIVESVRSLLESNFPDFEVLVVNDGSSDGTTATLMREFALVEVDRVPRANLDSKPVHATYVSATEPRLGVIDKENGGKADAMNAGISYAAFPLVCMIDADTMLDRDALARLVFEFEANSETVAAGGIVRVVNGSRFEAGRLVEVRTPRQLLVNLQILEYLRAFLGGRIAWSRTGMLLIISGAFGLFRRDALVEIGGYDATTVGEDAELIMRLHRHMHDSRRPYKITFFPDPICWTEAPSTLKALIGQRDRWQRGLVEMLIRHRKVLGRRRYGAIGTVAMPYFAIFEAFGPLIEAFGYTMFAITIALGWVSLPAMLAFAGACFAYGLVLSFAVLMMEQRAFQRYPGWRDLRRLIVTTVVENFGYRQLMSFVRARAMWRMLRRRESTWGEMTRVGFGDDSAEPKMGQTPHDGQMVQA